ncbi:MAG: thioesterase [Pirellulales bacterium]|nr:thioesterase [Pirellulales bacterium]
MMLDNHYGTPWVRSVRRTSPPAARLFCLPYAAGSASIFRHWQNALPESLEVCAVQLPGRADRRHERPLARVGSLVEVAGHALEPLVDRPFAIFGHSMGTLLAFELARWLEARGCRPALLATGGRGAPEFPDPGPALHAAPQAALVDELLRLGGTSREMFADAERMARLVPIIRADFAVCETYVFRPAERLRCPIVAFGGAADPDWPEPQIAAWGEHTQDEFSYHMLPGDHFFLHSCEREFLAQLRAACERFVR